MNYWLDSRVSSIAEQNLKELAPLPFFASRLDLDDKPVS